MMEKILLANSDMHEQDSQRPYERPQCSLGLLFDDSILRKKWFFV
jgi:hypothetical protein